MRATRKLLLLALVLASCAGGEGATPRDVLTPPDYCRDEGWRDGGELAGDTLTPVPAQNVRVLRDPFGVAPLSALVVVEGIAPACVRTVSVTVEGSAGEPVATTLPYDEGFAQRFACPDLLDPRELGVPALGLLPDDVNRVTVTIDEGGARHRLVVDIETPPLHPSLPEIAVQVAQPERMEPGWNLASFSAGENGFKPRPFLYDPEGRIRWFLRVDEALSPGFVTPMEPLANGNLLLAVGDTVYEYSLLGREVSRWLLPEGFEQHHDVFEMANGNLLVCARKRGTRLVTASGAEIGSSEDQLLELDRATGEMVNHWDLRRFLDIDRYSYMKTGDGQDWLHLNSAIHDPADDSVVVSGKHQGLAKITRGGENRAAPEANKALRWILAPHRGWQRAGHDGQGEALAPYLLRAVDAAGAPYDEPVQQGIESREDFGWVYSQHAPVLLPDGDLFVFDNGGGRDLHQYAGEPHSRGVVFRIVEDEDGSGGTVQQRWQYGRERGAELYAPVISDVDVGAVTGNRFVQPGSYTTRPDGRVGGVAKMVEIDPTTGDVVYEAHILMQGEAPWGDDICYRQERWNLFP